MSHKITIGIEIDGRKVELSLDEAKKLYDILDSVFNPMETVYIGWPPWWTYVKQEPLPPYTITCGSTADDVTFTGGTTENQIAFHGDTDWIDLT